MNNTKLRGVVSGKKAAIFREWSYAQGLNPNAVITKFVNIALNSDTAKRDKSDIEILYVTRWDKPKVLTANEQAYPVSKHVLCDIRKDKADAFRAWCAKRGTTVSSVIGLIVNSVVDDKAKYEAQLELHNLYTMNVD